MHTYAIMLSQQKQYLHMINAHFTEIVTNLQQLIEPTILMVVSDIHKHILPHTHTVVLSPIPP